MTLYLIVYLAFAESEPEWFFVARDRTPTDKEATQLAETHYRELMIYDKDEQVLLDDCWVDKVGVKGYEVTLQEASK